MVGSTFGAVRRVTGAQRPPHEHGCKPVEVVPGVWTAHFHDVENTEKLKAVSGSITTVVNCATDKCPTKEGSYGEGIEVLVVEGLLDDPDAKKKVDAMPEGKEKDEAKAALPEFKPEECAGDAKKDFDRVIEAMVKAKESGGASLVHCYASLSRSVAFILAYIMKTEKMTLLDATKKMKETWDATWPNDTFVRQLLEYEAALGLAGTPGVVEMKVTTKRSPGFYINAARSFFTGLTGKDGETKEPVCVLHISGLGEAVSVAGAAAAALESQGLAVIKSIQTSYPEVGKVPRACPRIQITLWHK